MRPYCKVIPCVCVSHFRCQSTKKRFVYTYTNTYKSHHPSFFSLFHSSFLPPFFLSTFPCSFAPTSRWCEVGGGQVTDDPMSLLITHALPRPVLSSLLLYRLQPFDLTLSVPLSLSLPMVRSVWPAADGGMDQEETSSNPGLSPEIIDRPITAQWSWTTTFCVCVCVFLFLF